ncbi:hypothetical protein M23134_07884 [Microscilla marina ATCC 23134]|uniref:STAS/SEC14 domain-containing protein n=2 Tax=Microscilla marina TaxID=1027 RepID=A1ZLN2_MICM2|nr:hypothetical protein M23134_07884 [Microscilla marina ATCC 23134]
MLQELFNSDFCTISFNKSQQNIQIAWQTPPVAIENQDFKDSLSQLVLVIEAYQPVSLIINAEYFNFTIEPELQEWYQQNIITKYLEANIKKIGIIKPQDFVTGLSMEQMFKAVVSSGKISLSFFNDIDAVNDWLNEQEIAA